jgi:Bacterial Ig domain/Bacterial Ig-like domain (group 2)
LRSIAFFVLFLDISLFVGCGGSQSGTPAPPPAPQVTSLTVSPQFVYITVGNTQQLSVSANLSDGSTQTPQSPGCTSSSKTIADITAPGLVSGYSQGTVTVTCTDSGVSGSTGVTVEPSFTTKVYQSGTLLYLENDAGSDVVLLGIDTSLGGAVSQFSLNGTDVVAKAGYGSHLIAVGLYDGDATYDSCNGCTGSYGWNPVESCDVYRHGSPIVAQQISGNTIYIKTNALQWIPDDKGGGPTIPIPSDIMIERWFSPVDNHPYVFQERYKITHIGPDVHANATNAVPSYELNANQFTQFAFYTGSNPGTDATPTTLPTAEMVQYPLTGTVQWLSEYWGGFFNERGVGFAAYSPQAFPYAAPSQATTDPTDQEVGFAFFSPFSFKPNTSVQFDTFLMLGNFKALQTETYDIRRALGPFPDIAPPVGDLNATPSPGSSVSGTVSIDGWAFDSVSSTKVDLYVDSTLTASGAANINRPDIAIAYPGAPTNPAFHFDLDTTKIANGIHTIEVRAKDDAGNVGILPHRILTVAN